MAWESIDWSSLQRLRATFLEAKPGTPDYWRSEAAVASYDLTFAQRIGWKWDCVLGELRRRSWSPPAGEVFDWACGSGIAGRAFFGEFSGPANTALRLADRSALALQFAARRARERFPGLDLRLGNPALPPKVLLVSHVLLELEPGQLNSLLELARGAEAVLWIEPGTHAASRALIAVREQLRARFRLVAPCVHQGPCGLQAPNLAHHWCHHFAPSPPSTFTDGDWARFASLMNIDLRRVPFSYLVLDRRPPPPLPDNAVRFIGRPRITKAFARVLGCAAAGVEERRIEKRELPDEFRAARKDALPALQAWTCEEDTITRLEVLP